MKMLKTVETSGKRFEKGTELEGLSPELIKDWTQAGYIEADSKKKSSSKSEE